MEEENIDEEFACKVILVGDSGVGKTSIIDRYLNHLQEKVKPTIGATFAQKIEIIDNYQISFDIWDTAGQERFRAINNIFYKEAYACIMVYDITNPETFESIKSYWYNCVKENASGEILFAVVGNKIDLYEEEKVDEEKVKEYCESIDAIFQLTSAKENTYIDELFSKLGQKFINSNLFKFLLSQNTENKKQKIELEDKVKDKKKKCC